MTEAERFPLLTERGRKFMEWLWEHPHAPRYVGRCGDRLDGGALAKVRAYEAALASAPRGWRDGEVPAWALALAARCGQVVPFHRRRARPGAAFQELPAVTRADLARAPWAFVPDDEPLDSLIVFRTSATSGHALRIPSHPEAVACRLPLLRRALASRGVALRGGPERVAIILVCAQRWTVTGAMVSSFLDEAGFAKVNLAESDWRDPADRARYLDACDAEVYTSDPVALAELARLPLTSRPRAILSTSQALLPAFRRRLEARFGCPVLDVYSMNEVGPVAVRRSDDERRWELLPHDLFVEILDEEGRPCPPGVRGEVTLTGGANRLLPLLRYRTGDHAALAFDGPEGDSPSLIDLEGRPPAVYRGAGGQRVHSMDVSTALRDLPLPQYALHQADDGALTLRLGRDDDRRAPLEALRALVGDLPITVEELAAAADQETKVVQYTSARSGQDE